MAGALTESIISGVMGQPFEISEGTKEMAKVVAREAAELVSNGIVTDLVLAGIDPSGVSLVRVATKIGLLAWKAGAYLHHNSTLQSQLAVCLEEYCEAGYLEKTTTPEDDKATIWQTTPAFSDAKMVLDIYPDVKQYLNDHAFTEAEMRKIGIYSDVSLYADSSKVNDLGHRLSACCARAGVKDITKTDAEKRIANVSFVQMGAIALQNAFIAEGERRELGNEPVVVPVLGRILSIAAICGLKEITIAEITTILGKAPILETIARARIAKLRKQHASHIFNALLFRGSTESAGELFEYITPGECVVVGRVKDIGKSEFLDEYMSPRCELSGPVEKNHEVGKPIYMMAGWANLIKRREPIEKQHSAITQMAHSHSPTKACDVHGNTYMSAGKMSKIVFTVRELADGPLMAKPHKFGRFDYNSKADFKKGSILVDAMGEEKLFGGIVGPAACSCQGGLAETNAKGQLIKGWRLGKGLKINSRNFVGNSISHTNDMSTKKISILWRPGDWAMGCFFMQTLPQSSYLQGRGQCLHCAVEGAALAGCPEVIACGGGKVSNEAFEHERQKAVMESQRPISTPAYVAPGSPASSLSSPVTGVFTPPPPYSSPPGSPRPAGADYFAISNASGDKIVPANAVMPIAHQDVPVTGIMPISEKLVRDRVFPLNDITPTSDDTVPTSKIMSSGDQIVPTAEIISICDKIAPANKNEVVAINDLISFDDQGTLDDIMPSGDKIAPTSKNEVVPTNDLISFDDQGAIGDTMPIGDKIAPTNKNEVVPTNDLISFDDQGTIDDIMLIGDKIAHTKQVRSEDETVATNEIMSIGDQVVTNDLISIGDQVATGDTMLLGDQVAKNNIMPINDKIIPTKHVRSEDETVATNDLMSIGDQVATDDITSIGDKVATDDITSVGEQDVTDDIASIADQLIPSIDIKSFAAKIGNNITRKALGSTPKLTGFTPKLTSSTLKLTSSTLKLTSSTPKPEEETATALYDFQVQGEGHLTFKRGDIIRIVKKPEDENEWWTGELNGKQGIFPGNTVSLCSAKNLTAEIITGKAVATSKRLGLRAAAASKKLGSTAAATSKKLGSTATETSKKLGSTATETSKKLGSTATATSKKLGSTATATSKKLGSTAAATSKKLGSTAAATSKKLGSTAAPKKPESTAAPKKPESTAAAAPEKPESTAAAASKKPESTATAAPEKPESTATAASKKPESTAAAAPKKLGSTAAATSKKLGSTAAVASKKLGSTARWLKKGYADMSRITGRNDAHGLGNAEICSSEDTTAGDTTTDNATVDDATADYATVADATADDATVDDATADDATADDATADDATVDDATADDATVDDATADDAAVDDATADDAAVDDAAVDDATVDDATADDATADDAAADDAAADDAAGDDAAADDATADDATVDDATADDATVEDVIEDGATVDDATEDDTVSEDFTAEDVIADDAISADFTAEDDMVDDFIEDDFSVEGF